ncbi:MAG: hypothetical protein ACM3ZT_11540 [Bacillota bacterium]
MDTRVHNDTPQVSGAMDPALRLTVEHLLAETAKRPCYHDVCREHRAPPDAVYRLIEGMTEQLKAKDELIKLQTRTIERLRFQLVELVKKCTADEGRQGLQ